MKPKEIMLIAGEASGDLLAAELVWALREELPAAETIYTRDPQPLRTGLEPRCFGAGGPRMRAAGVELAFDLTRHSVIGLDAIRGYLKFRRMFRQLFRMALERQPDAIVCVDFSGFNRRFAHAIREYARRKHGWFHPWNPKIIQYVSPQVWASREGRVYQIARDYDLLLSIFPFEKEWYARRVPHFRVEFVGHPIVDRFTAPHWHSTREQRPAAEAARTPHILLLPGSRPGEVHRHLPVMLDAMKLMRAKLPALRAKIVLPDESLVQQARALDVPADIRIQTGNLPTELTQADLAIASTGTVTMECAFFGVPTVTLYKTSLSTYLVGKQIVTVKWLSMPNILADEEVFPEFIQHKATPENIASAASALLNDPERRARTQATLTRVIASLGTPGATRRAARVITGLLLENTSLSRSHA